MRGAGRETPELNLHLAGLVLLLSLLGRWKPVPPTPTLHQHTAPRLFFFPANFPKMFAVKALEKETGCRNDPFFSSKNKAVIQGSERGGRVGGFSSRCAPGWCFLSCLDLDIPGVHYTAEAGGKMAVF